jgi:hypothetical protein
MITSLFEVRGRIWLEAGDTNAALDPPVLGAFVCRASATDGIPVSARQDALAAFFNNSRREILVSILLAPL